MNHIDRLLMQAKRAINGNGRLVSVFIEYDEIKRKYKAICNLWDGVAGSGVESLYSEYDVLEEALSACEAIAARYPGAESISFVNGLTFPGEE